MLTLSNLSGVWYNSVWLSEQHDTSVTSCIKTWVSDQRWQHDAARGGWWSEKSKAFIFYLHFLAFCSIFRTISEFVNSESFFLWSKHFLENSTWRANLDKWKEYFNKENNECISCLRLALFISRSVVTVSPTSLLSALFLHPCTVNARTVEFISHTVSSIAGSRLIDSLCKL